MGPFCRTDQVFASKLARTIDRQRSGRAVFAPRQAPRSVEYVVGGKMNERSSPCGRPFGYRAGRFAIDQKGKFTLLLGTINRGVSGWIDDEVGLQSRQRRPDRVRPREIDQAAIRLHERSEWLERGFERRTNLAGDARQENTHHT